MITGKIEINEQFKQALNLINDTAKNIFITGKAGTGKSTLLEYFRSITKKNIVVLAPTGVAALNVQGQTIHSFFEFKTDVTYEKIKKIIKKGEDNIYAVLDAIVIDEVSMVRADLLDCVDKFLRLNCNKDEPFGGKQMIFFGDLYQLPPVITSREREIFTQKYSTGYFFSAHVMQNMEMELIELEKIYRQKDNKFIEILNAIRNNTVTDEMLSVLNKRHEPDFEPPEDEFYICLTTRNDQAQRVNEEQLNRIKGRLYQFEADINGDFSESSYPTEEFLSLKKNAQVMMLNNDSQGRWVNGSMGVIQEFDEDESIICIDIMGGEEVLVSPYKWQLFNYTYDADTQKIETEKLGSFTQYPLKLAWAVTIHKSQGKTFDKVIIDIQTGTFTPGQMYVGLSRCTSLEGLVLKQKIKKSHIFMDWKVAKFMTNHQYKNSEKQTPFDEKIRIIEEAINKKGKLEITYLKNSDVKTKRIIQPVYVGDMEYMEKTYQGVEAYCLERKEMRNFRIDRILEMKEVK